MSSEEQSTRSILTKHFLLIIFYCLPALVKNIYVYIYPIRYDILVQIAASVRSQAVSILEDADASSSGDKRDTCQKEESFQNLLMNLQDILQFYVRASHS